MQDILDSLDGQYWFSTVDMSKAYHQGYTLQDCRKFTAFSTPWAVYEWIRIPYGLTNPLSCFQPCINECLGWAIGFKIYCLFRQHLDLWMNL